MNKSTNPNDPCVFLQWDTDFFGHRIARAHGHTLDKEGVRSILAWCRQHNIECLYFLANSDQPETIRLAEDNRFRLVEVRMNMGRSIKAWDPESRQKNQDVSIRHARPEDLPVLEKIGALSYVNSRFFFDDRFSEEKWQAYYATWVRNSCSGSADLAYVAELDGNVVGYITGNIDQQDPTVGIYELTGVAPEARRAGVGQELFRSGIDWYVEAGVERIWFATQGRNIPTQRMVQRDGFYTLSCQLYYHKWFDDPET